MGSEFAETASQSQDPLYPFDAGSKVTTYWASSHVTIGDSPILYILVKKARKVKINGAIINSYSSSMDSNDCSA